MTTPTQRYARQMRLPQVGESGQRALGEARVLIVGAGGLGSVTATYLAAAGVGTLGIVDDDRVEISNLHRQVLHDTAELGAPKVDSAARRLAAINPLVHIERHPVRLDAGNALDLVAAYDVVVDGADNFATRYVVADAAALTGRPHVWGSILRFDGQVSVWWPPHGPCYRCVFPEPPAAGSVDSCAEAGVLGSLCAAIGAAQSTETVKVLLGIGEPLVGRLLVHDALAARWESVPVRRNPACPLCGGSPTITAPSVPAACALPDGRMTAEALAADLDAGARLVLLDVREPAEWADGVIPGARLLSLHDLAALEVPRDTRVVAYCAGGVRSARAVGLLRERGFTDVTDLDGGITAWRRARPLVPAGVVGGP